MGSSAAEISSARVLNNLAVTDELKDVGSGTGQTHTHDDLDSAAFSFTASSDPPGKYYSAQTLALVAGVATIDLTSLPGLQAAIDGTGLKLQFLRIRGEADGSNAVLNIAPGAVNPYSLFGAANDIDYPAACTKPFTFEFDEGTEDVDATHKNIDLAGTGTDSFFVEMILG